MPVFEQDSLAPYAVHARAYGGRAHPESDDPLRTPFQLDRHRIIESTAFRRLEGKTQVFTPARHDHFRTRLTHTLEAAQIARTLAGALRVNEDLAEAIVLAHDLGHPPFGHAGEAALDEVMTDQGGFNHNLHTLRVVDYLEHPFPAFRGLNLTTETRAGLAAHCTQYDRPAGAADGDASANREPRETAPVFGAPSAEAQAASLADQMAYGCHDLEDAIGAGYVTLDGLGTLPLWRAAYETAGPFREGASIHEVRRAVLDGMLDAMLRDVVEASTTRLADLGSVADVRACPLPAVAPSQGMALRLAELDAFLARHVYTHPEVSAADAEGRRMVVGLFERYVAQPDRLPPRFAARVEEQGAERVTCDYLAGMTDRFCRAEAADLPAAPA